MTFLYLFLFSNWSTNVLNHLNGFVMVLTSKRWIFMRSVDNFVVSSIRSSWLVSSVDVIQYRIEAKFEISDPTLVAKSRLS